MLAYFDEDGVIFRFDLAARRPGEATDVYSWAIEAEGCHIDGGEIEAASLIGAVVSLGAMLEEQNRDFPEDCYEGPLVDDCQVIDNFEFVHWANSLEELI